MFGLALKFLKTDKIRTLFTSIGIILSVSLMIIIGVLNLSMYKTFKNIYTNESDNTDIIVKKNNGFSEQDIQFIQKIDGVAALTPKCSLDVSIYNNGKKEKVWTKGISVDTDRNLRDYLFIEGNWFSSKNSREIIINKQSAESLGIKYNDDIKVHTRSGAFNYKVIGIVEDKNLGSSQKLEMYTPLTAITSDSGFAGWYYILNIDVSKDELIDEVAYKIKNKFGNIVSTQTLTENLKVAKKSLDNIKMGLYAILIIVILSGMLFIYETFIIIIYERINTIGMLKALGMNKRQMIKMFLTEGLLLGIFGSAVGAVIGIFGSFVVLKIIKAAVYTNLSGFDISPSIFFTSIAVGLLMSIFACIIPAIKAGKYSPVKALKQNEQYNMQKKVHVFPKLRLIIGLSMMVLSFFYFNIVEYNITSDTAIRNFLLPIGYVLIFISFIIINPILMGRFLAITNAVIKKFFRREVILSTRNLARNSSRTNVIISFIVISVAVSIGFNGMFNSLKQSMQFHLSNSINSDIIINTNWNLDNKESFDKYNRLENISEIDWIYYTRNEFFKDNNNESHTIIGIDKKKIREFGNIEILQGSAEYFFNESLNNKRTALVGKYYIKNGYKIGDKISLPGKNKTFEFEIVGIVNDFIYNGKIVYIHRDMLDNMMENKLCNNIYIKSNKNTDVNLLINTIDSKIIQNDSSSISSSLDYKKELENEISSSSFIFDIINIIVLLIAVLGLMNAILISILRRKSEISMLRSIGSTQRFIQKMIFHESIIMIVYGTITGIILGTALAWKTKAIMESVNYSSIKFYIPFGFLIQIVFIVVIFSMIATIYPSLKASRTPIINT